MTWRLPQHGDVDMDDVVYEALMPLDGWPKGTRGGPRPYSLTMPDGDRYIVVMGLSDFGDLIVLSVLPVRAGAEPELDLWKTVAAKTSYLLVCATQPELDPGVAEREAARYLAGCLQFELEQQAVTAE